MQLGYWEITLAILIPGILYASWIDFAERRVPNWLNAALALAGLGAQFAFGGWNGLGVGLTGLLVGFGVLIVPWLMHGMGAGDVKLMAAVGALKGPIFLVFASFYVIVAAGLAAIVVLAVKRRLIPTLRWAATLMVSAFVPGFPPRQLGVEQTEMPFAPAIFLGVAYAAVLEMAHGPFSF